MTGVWPRPGELAGVLARIAVVGEPGEDGRRNGDARGELNDKGDGLYGIFEFMLKVLIAVLELCCIEAHCRCSAVEVVELCLLVVSRP